MGTVLTTKPCGCIVGVEHVGAHQVGHREGCRFDAFLGIPEDVPFAPHETWFMVAPHTLWVRDDGGRKAAGFTGTAPGDCGARALAIAAQRPYREVYDLINLWAKRERPNARRARSNARTGVHSDTMRRMIAAEFPGASWTATTTIGSGTTTHLRADELPAGRIIVRVSRHYAAMVDGVLRDSHDCTRDGTRAVYGYWTFT